MLFGVGKKLLVTPANLTLIQSQEKNVKVTGGSLMEKIRKLHMQQPLREHRKSKICLNSSGVCLIVMTVIIASTTKGT